MQALSDSATAVVRSNLTAALYYAACSRIIEDVSEPSGDLFP